MELVIEKCAVVLMKSGKRHLTSRMKLPKQDKIEHSKKTTPTPTLTSWRVTPSNEWR